MFEYKCKLLRVVDGDTIDVDIDLGFGVWMRKQRIRMYGIDSPESRTRDQEEKKYGFASKNFADKSINQYCIDKHHAVAYFGQSKIDIEEQHIKNRELVTL